ncbi:MAG: peptidylprolyl isomerase [Anaerosomatales bacterium]|nr:peptidylprolyl isomerase [Anaerosomatales bacterium]
MKPKNGDTVRVHYKGTLNDGSEFDSSAGRDPLEFVLGEGQVIPGFESAVSDLEAGEKATFTVACADAYGERVDARVQQVPMSAFAAEPTVGIMVEVPTPDGHRIPAVVSAIEDEMVTLDFNHPLAGEDLTFEVELVEVVEA